MRDTNPTVPFMDLNAVNARHGQALQQAANRVIGSGWYVGGTEVSEFEQAFAHYCGVQQCVGTGNGLDALTLILKAWLAQGRLQLGDEVLVPANSFIASALAVTASGLNLKLLDPNPHSFNITAQQVENALTQRTKVVMTVHLYGQLADIQALQQLCQARGLLLIEDAAQAHGAHINGQRAGSWGDAAAFSFYPAKNLGALGDGGAVVSSDSNLIHLVRQLGNYGSDEKYHHPLLGVNSRLDALQAAFLQVRLPYLDQDNSHRQQIAQDYLQQIHNPHVQLPTAATQPTAHVWHIFALTSRYRQQLQQHLTQQGIATGIHYPLPIHRQVAYLTQADLKQAPTATNLVLPISERLAAEQLSLPISPVQSDQQTQQVIAAVNSFCPVGKPKSGKPKSGKP